MVILFVFFCLLVYNFFVIVFYLGVFMTVFPTEFSLCNNNLDKLNDLSVSDISINEFYSTIAENIKLVFLELGVLDSKIGVQYWIDAVYIFLRNNKDTRICKDIYNTIADKYNKSAMSVERSMRYCFQNAEYLIASRKNYVTRFLKNIIKQYQNTAMLFALADIVLDDGFNKLKQSKQFALEHLLEKDINACLVTKMKN